MSWAHTVPGNPVFAKMFPPNNVPSDVWITSRREVVDDASAVTDARRWAQNRATIRIDPEKDGILPSTKMRYTLCPTLVISCVRVVIMAGHSLKKTLK